LTPDALIFDMDGTLWDAVDTYVACWNSAFKQLGVERVITRSELQGMMGMESHALIKHAFPHFSQEQLEEAHHKVFRTQDELQLRLGGKIYPFVKEGLELLSHKYKLFLLSNCEKNGLPLFMQFIGIEHLITDHISYGDTFRHKYQNMHTLIQRYNLQRPVYVGDTESDSKESHLAGVPFVFVRYGFGETKNYSLAFDSFEELTDYFMSLPDFPSTASQ